MILKVMVDRIVRPMLQSLEDFRSIERVRQSPAINVRLRPAAGDALDSARAL